MRKLGFVFFAITFVIISACELHLPRRGEILCSAPAIITAIRRANTNPDPSIIQLPDGCDIVLTDENNSTTIGVGRGGNGLPTIRSPITIRGSSEGSTIRRADTLGTPEFRIFYIDGASGGELNLERIALTNGWANNGGGVFIDEGVLRLMDGVEISGNNAARSGGAIFSWNGILEKSGAGLASIVNNQAISSGGGVYAIRNPGLSADVGRNILRLDDIVFQGNRVTGTTGKGGGIYTNADQMTLNNISFQENVATFNGGAIYIGGGGGSAANIDNSEFVSNSADSGGAIYNARGDSGSETTDGEIRLFNSRGNAGLVIWDSWFYGNYAQTDGGAIYNGEEVNISDSLFEENEAGEDGGAIFNWPSGILDIINSTFSKNKAPEAPAIFNFGQAYISYTTISESDGRGALFSWYATIELANLIVANNGGEDCYFKRYPLRLLGTNLDSDATCDGFDFTINPVLGPLQDNGGPTHTYALLASSPAIGAASGFCPDSDQRGELRPPGDSCDLGAYETSLPVVAALELSGEYIEVESIPIDTIETTPTAIAIRNASCRSGADAAFEVHNFLHEGQTALLIGRMTEGTWFYLELPDDLGRCWVFAENLTLAGPIDQLLFFTSPELPLPDDGGDDEGGGDQGSDDDGGDDEGGGDQGNDDDGGGNDGGGKKSGGGGGSAPAAPSNLSYQCKPGFFEFTLSWTDNSDNEDGFRIFKDGQQVGSVGANLKSFVYDPGGANPSSYTVEAFNGTGTAKATLGGVGCLP